MLPPYFPFPPKRFPFRFIGLIRNTNHLVCILIFFFFLLQKRIAVPVRGFGLPQGFFPVFSPQRFNMKTIYYNNGAT